MVIDKKFLAQMIRQARNGFPDESCGILATKDGVVTQVFPIDNVSESPVVYRMDPDQQLKAMLAIEDEGWDVGAIYHSHTRTRAYPSRTDVELSFYPDALQIIISLADQERPDVRAYRIADGEVTEETLEVIPTTDDARQEG